MKSKTHLNITKKDIPKNIFEIINNKVYLKNSKALPFKMNFPLKLNEDLAKIAAMILDGTIDKNLNSLMFSQRKDKTKIPEFYKIIKKYFNLSGKIRGETVNYSRKSLTSFLYYCLDIHKSDECARIPKWVWKSSKNVIREYLRYAYAMEGSIDSILKGGEIRFHSVRRPHLVEIKGLMSLNFNIKSKIYRYYIKSYGWKYYLSITNFENIRKFYENIGFALESHQKILEHTIENTKSKAWEMTLVMIPV